MCTLTIRSRLSQYTNIPMHMEHTTRTAYTTATLTIHAIDGAALLFLLLDCWYFPFHFCWLFTFRSLALSLFLTPYDIRWFALFANMICVCVQICPFYLLYSLHIVQFRLWKHCSGNDQRTNILYAVCIDWHPVYAYRYSWYVFLYVHSQFQWSDWRISFFFVPLVIADLGRVFATAVSALSKKMPSFTSKFRSWTRVIFCEFHSLLMHFITN